LKEENNVVESITAETKKLYLTLKVSPFYYSYKAYANYRATSEKCQCKRLTATAFVQFRL